jgi:hypothetical protein
MSWNERYLGHGVQSQFRRVTPDGVPYAANGDGCEIIDFRTGELAHPLSGWVMPIKKDPVQMSTQMEQACRTVPVVWHVGGADLVGKAKRFHRFWHKQWDTLRQNNDSLEARTWGTSLDMENPTDEDFKKAADDFLALNKTYKIWMPPPKKLEIWLSKVGAM